MTFHVNPKTGNAGMCRAFHGRCPFGGEDEHFEDKTQAQKAFERKQEKFEHFLWKTKLPATKGSYVLAVYDPMSEEVPVGALWGNPVYAKFLKKLEEAEDKTRLVIENGQIWEKNNVYGETSWKFVYGNYDNLSRLEPHKTYDVAWLGRTIQTHGARLENGGAMPKMSLEHLRDVYPNREQILEEAEELKQLFNYKNPAAEEQALREQLEDHITERWSGLSPKQWEALRPELEKAVGEPLNIGTENSPRWVWSE